MENPKKKKKKSTAQVSQVDWDQVETVVVSDEETKIYNAACLGHESEMNELLNNVEKHVSKNEMADIVQNIFTQLKLNNVDLSQDIELKMHEYLSERFFSSKNNYKMNDIKEHVKLLASLVDYADFFEDEQEKLLYSLKLVIKEIHLLKTLLRFTYNLLPWEEIEFYLFCYILSSTANDDLNVFYKVIIKKGDIIGYLQSCIKCLKKLRVSDNEELSILPDMTRDEAARKIIEKFPAFAKLYKDVNFLRDIHSLYKICKYARLLETISHQERRGNEMIIRVLHVIAEQLKYTLESPNLSPIKGHLLFISLGEETRKIISHLLNTVCNEEALAFKKELIKSCDENLLETIRLDLLRLREKTEDLIFRHFIKLLVKHFQEAKDKSHILLDKIENSSSMLLYAKEEFRKFANSNTPFVSNMDKLIEIMKRFQFKLAEKDENRRFDLKKITDSKYSSENKEFTWDTILNTILKPGAESTLLNYHPGFSKAEVDTLLEIACSFQKENCQDNEAERLNTEMINLLLLEVDNEDYFTEKLAEVNMNRQIFISEKNSGVSYERMFVNDQTMLFEYRDTLKKVLNKTPYSKIRVKSLEIMKSQVLDFICISNILSHKEKDKKYSRDMSMLTDYLKSDYELVDLFFNPNMIVYHIANHHELFMNHQSNEEMSNKFKNAFNDELVIISKKLHTRSKLVNGEFDKFKASLQKGADVRAKDADKFTYLHLASANKSDVLIEYLCDEDFDLLHSKNLEVQTPLHIAAKNGNENIVSYFLSKRNSLVHSTDKFGRTALHIATLSNQPQIVKILVNGVLDPLKRDLLGFSSALYAVLEGNVPLLGSLLSNQEELNETQKTEVKTLFQIAVYQNQPSIVDFFLSKGVTFLDEEDGVIAMTSAVSLGLINMVEILLNRGVYAKNIILTAVQKNQDLIMEMLLKAEHEEANAVNSENGMTPLHYAVKNGNNSILDLLLQYNVNIGAVNSDNNTPLHLAVEKNNLYAVVAFINKSEDMVKIASLMNSRRFTPLHIAAEAGYFEIAKLLIEHWVPLENEDYAVYPLHLAKQNGHDKIVKLLVENGATYSNKEVPKLNSFKLDKGQNLKNNEKKPINTGPANHPKINLTQKILDNPTIIIWGADTDELKKSDDEMLTEIIEQNNFEGKIKNKMEILRKYTKNKKCAIVMVLQKSIYDKIMAKKTLNIGWNSCSVSDYFYVYRCYKCAGFRHDETSCEHDQVCFKCAENHSENGCKSQLLKCIHCSLGLNIDTNHSSMDQLCPWYRKILKDKYEKQKRYL